MKLDLEALEDLIRDSVSLHFFKPDAVWECPSFELLELLRQHKIMRLALEFYADHDNYNQNLAPTYDHKMGIKIEDWCGREYDCGQKARQALEQIRAGGG